MRRDGSQPLVDDGGQVPFFGPLVEQRDAAGRRVGQIDRRLHAVLVFDDQLEPADDRPCLPAFSFSLVIFKPLTYVPFVLPQSST